MSPMRHRAPEGSEDYADREAQPDPGMRTRKHQGARAATLECPAFPRPNLGECGRRARPRRRADRFVSEDKRSAD